MTLALNAHRPFFPNVNARGWFGWAKKINWTWWLQRLPMSLLAIPSAYGVGAFSAEHLPLWVAVIQGLAFECTYLGAVAFADQQDEGDKWTTALWWGVNLGAVLSSVICNLLWVSSNHFANIGPESFAHATPMPVLGFLYGLLLHRNNSKVARRAFEESERQREQEETDQQRTLAEAEEQKAREREAELRDQFRCVCNASFLSEPALRSHRGKCQVVKAGLAQVSERSE